jgi:hypothetical protein
MRNPLNGGADINMHADPKPKLAENEILLSTNTLLDCFCDMGLILTAPES